MKLINSTKPSICGLSKLRFSDGSMFSAPMTKCTTSAAADNWIRRTIMRWKNCKHSKTQVTVILPSWILWLWQVLNIYSIRNCTCLPMSPQKEARNEPFQSLTSLNISGNIPCLVKNTKRKHIRHRSNCRSMGQAPWKQPCWELSWELEVRLSPRKSEFGRADFSAFEKGM